MLRRLIYPHSLIVTCMMFVLIWFLDVIRINLHFLNPFNETIRDYQVTDIVYSRLRSSENKFDDRIVLVNSGIPNRDTIRLMLDRIVDAGAKVVSVDILFSEQKAPLTDSLLRASLQRMENITLAVRLGELVEGTEIFKPPVDCDTFFCDEVYTGFVNFITYDTSTISTVRLFSPSERTTDGDCLSFAARTAQLYDPQAAKRLFNRRNEVEEIYYTGNENQFFQYEPKDILDTTIDLSKRIRGKIVLLGFCGSYMWDDDRHYTPLNSQYTGRNAPDMYGMVIHANIIRMILDNSYVNELSFWVNLLLTFVFCYLNIHLFYQIFRRVSLPYQFITRFLQLGEIILLFFIVALLFHFYRIKMDVAYWITGLLLTFDAVKFYHNGLRKRIPILRRIPEFLPANTPKKKAVKLIEKPIDPEPVPSAPPADPASKK